MAVGHTESDEIPLDRILTTAEKPEDDAPPSMVAAPRSASETEVLERQTATPNVDVGVRALFRYATASDVAIMAASAVCAIAGGAALPLMILFFGRLQGTFQGYAGAGATAAQRDAFSAQVNKLVLNFVYLAIGEFVAIYVAMAGFIYTGERLSNQIRRHYLRSCLRQNVGFFDARLSSGEVATCITADVDQIRAGISEKVALVLTALATFVSAFVISFATYWKLTLVLLSVLVALLAVMGVSSVFLAKYSVPWIQSMSEAGVIAGDVLGAIRNTISFGTQDRLCKMYDDALVEAERHGFRVKAVGALMLAGIMLIASLDYALSFWAGSTFLLHGETSVASVIITLMAVMMGSFDLGNVAPHMQAFNTALSSTKKLFNTIDRVPPPDLDPSLDIGRKITKIDGSIRLENVRHIYPSRPDVVVLDDFSLDIPAGKTTALVGASGSGKSSIIALLERFYSPLSGTIYLDGHDIRTLNLRSYRQAISLVEQEPTLSDTTIFDNIRQGLAGSALEHESKERQGELVIEAAKKAFAHDFITGLAEGYQSRVGERGARLSGGQKQRIAIARAIVSDPKILLLDEATSALDSTSERAIQAALKSASAGRTTVTVAHRLATIEDADQIVVLNKGSIVEKGTHAELLAKRNAYFRLVDAQAAPPPPELDTHSDVSPASATDFGQHKDGPEPDAEAPAAREQTAPPPQAAYGLWTLIKLVASLNRDEWPLMLWGCLWSVVGGAGNPVNAFLLGKQIMTLSAPVVDQNVKRESDFWSAMYVALAAAMFVAFLAQGLALARCSERLIHRVRHRAFATMLRQEMGFFDRKGTGALLTFLSTRAAEVAGLSGAVLGTLITALSTFVGSLALSLAVGWKLSLVCMCSIPILLACGFLRFHMLFRFQQRAQAAFAPTAAEACEAVASIRTVAALAREAEVMARYDATRAAQQRASVGSLLSSSALYAASQSLFFLAFALGFWYGGTLIASGEYTMFQFFVCFAAIVFNTQSTGTFFSYARDMGQARQAAAELKALFDARVGIDTWSSAGGPVDPRAAEGVIEFRGVEFAYPAARRPVLRQFDLTIRPGQSVALVGSSGCGKSTALSLIERLYDPDAGTVRLDGRDVRELNVNQYRSMFAIVPQEPVLYRGTIRANILLGAVAPDEVTDDDVATACREAGIEDFIASLPEGLDTAVGSAGTLLSGGQKQRIALARALVRKPRVLLLDEATSSLDAESERTVQAALDRAAASRTTVSVAHKLSTVRRADVIVVLDGGRVVEMGSHQELMERNGMYAHMTKLQELSR